MLSYQQVILVNEQDEEIGIADKLEAHQKGLLHRAFSIFIVNQQGQILLHKRAYSKYHSGGLWTNACCSHPAPGESLEAATQRRLQEELGFTTQLQFAFHFLYAAPVDNALFEHEFDYVFVGQYTGEIKPNEDEVAEIGYFPLSFIEEDMQQNPNKYTVWFKIAFPRFKQWYSQQAL